MILQALDELNLDAVKDELDELAKMAVHDMENAWELSVPLSVEYGTGQIGLGRIRVYKSTRSCFVIVKRHNPFQSLKRWKGCVEKLATLIKESFLESRINCTNPVFL